MTTEAVELHCGVLVDINTRTPRIMVMKPNQRDELIARVWSKAKADGTG